ncbi:sugar O-acyltransferase (sialic acid O-acetyltransferase NeuD family) [Paucimonas lemoignei]|uniref:Sugar O-acyltransferase (Sialic acid O-acetyltransferase NeuD family) n=1 Tax=Paucimonas lemoignei TaxID=29443 RepID=A0A4R3HSK1_PAULE|nr:NeuD/PglB/VioB family sugar acetyltransferase [Paucimonas lemoignei]TCS35101.1 sugar O-acyltransferase (sialic acid O-acetyltransferase NeuD family) [Paucimonas lemoignei]
MRIRSIFLVGAGGHGKVVLDALIRSDVAIDKICILDSNTALLGKELCGLKINIPIIQNGLEQGEFHIAIGNGKIRQNLYLQLLGIGSMPLSVIHPDAVVSRFSTIGLGSFIAARAIIAPAAEIGEGSIINHGAVVDHDCTVGSFSHVAPNVTLGGAVKVGARVLIGAGANILPNIKIGDDAVIGAGAVVLNDIAAGETYVGVPATSISRSNCD